MSNLSKKYSIVIIGGGIVGCAIAYKLSAKGHKNIAVIEKNITIPGRNQSSRSGGVIHSGLYYPKDIEPLKAMLCVEGIILLYEFLQKYNLPYHKVGKLILACNPLEDEYLELFQEVGYENGVFGIDKISGLKAKSMEPNIGNVKSALYVPSTGWAVLDPIVEKLKNLAEEKGVTFLLDAKVISIIASQNQCSLMLETNKGTEIIQTHTIINSAGLYADEIAKMINPTLNYEIDPTRGEFYKFDKSKRINIWISGMHLYATPYCYFNDTKQKAAVSVSELRKLLKAGRITKTLGVHLSSHGNTVVVGPLKTFNINREDYSSKLKKVEDYIMAVCNFFPNLKAQDLKSYFTGITAVRRGFTDFTIEKDKKFPNCINLVGMDSPAWTASLAIANYVTKMIN